MGVGTASGGGAVEPATTTSPQSTTAAAPSGSQSQAQNIDLLADLFGGSTTGTTKPSSPAPASPSPNKNTLMDLLGGEQQQPVLSTKSNNSLDSLASLGQSIPIGGGNSPSQRSMSPSTPAGASPALGSTSVAPSGGGYEAYSKNGLSVRLSPSRDRNNPALVLIQATFANSGAQGVINGLQFQAAVPKSQKLQMAPASSTTVQPNSTEKQMMRIFNPQQVNMLIIMMNEGKKQRERERERD